MKISVDFSKKSYQETQVLWHQMGLLRDRLTRRLSEDYLLEVDPVRERFYLVSLEEAFSFHLFPYSFEKGEGAKYAR